jgi:hypothetical protein
MGRPSRYPEEFCRFRFVAEHRGAWGVKRLCRERATGLNLPAEARADAATVAAVIPPIAVRAAIVSVMRVAAFDDGVGDGVGVVAAGQRQQGQVAGAALDDGADGGVRGRRAHDQVAFVVPGDQAALGLGGPLADRHCA